MIQHDMRYELEVNKTLIIVNIKNLKALIITQERLKNNKIKIKNQTKQNTEFTMDKENSRLGYTKLLSDYLWSHHPS